MALRSLTYSCCGRATCSDGRRQLDPKSSNGGPAPYTYTYTYIHTHTWTSRCHTLGLHVAQRIVWDPLGRGFADQAASRLLQHPADEAGCQKADEQHHARHHRIGLCHTLGLQVAQRIVWAPLGRGSADPDPCGAHRSKGLKSFARLDLAGQGDGVVEAFVAHEVHVDRVLEKLVPVKGNHAFGFAWETHLQAKTLKEEPVDEHDSA